MKLKPLIHCLLAAALSGAAVLTLHSQDANPPPPPSDRPPRPPGGQAPYLAGFGPVGNVLTEEQRASMREAMEPQREQMRDLENKLREARKKLLEAGVAEKFDEEAVRKQALAVAQLEVEGTVLRARALSKVQPPLSAEQIEKIKAGLSAAPARMNPRAAGRLQPDAGRHRPGVISTNRDENDLPPKQ